jgi:hypothetical protein
MEPSTVTQPDSTAAVTREAAPDDTVLGGSRGILGVAKGLVALWLTLECAVTAALVGVPAGALYFFVKNLSSASLGEGTDAAYAFRDTARMHRREPYTVELDWSTTTARWGRVLLSTWELTFVLFFFPVCYVAYLGASLKVCCVVLGSAVLAFMVSSVGFVVSEKDAFIQFSGALGLSLSRRSS